MPMTEAQFQAAVIDLARLCGWRVMHTRAAQIRPGVWATPIQGDAGFPDLVLCRPIQGDFIVAELKTETGRVSAGQHLWLRALDAAGVETYVWRPTDLPTIKTRLRRVTK